MRLAAAPVDGAANDALIDLLARTLDVPKRNLALVRGARSRDKQVVIERLTPDEAARRIGISTHTSPS